MPPGPAAFFVCNYLLSQVWLAMPQLVLQADWQEVWHSPQPPFLALSHRLRVSMVTICSMGNTSINLIATILSQKFRLVNNHLWDNYDISTASDAVALRQNLWYNAKKRRLNGVKVCYPRCNGQFGKSISACMRRFSFWG